MDFFAYIPWFAWIALAGIASWVIVTIITTVGKNKAKAGDADLARVVAENTEINKALLTRLETIDSRLGAVEKTLNDIPQ